jgi:hypothetical protein
MPLAHPFQKFACCQSHSYIEPIVTAIKAIMGMGLDEKKTIDLTMRDIINGYCCKHIKLVVKVGIARWWSSSRRALSASLYNGASKLQMHVAATKRPIFVNSTTTWEIKMTALPV